jgi:DTW domain-containing protein YfiP
MHPQEAFKQKTGTGRLASLSLKNSEIIIDTSFDNNFRTQELISDPLYYPMVLYPGKEAFYAETFNFEKSTEKKTLLVFLIDATWSFAGKMMRISKTLQELPKLSFSNEYRSKFLIKKQPKEYCLSTIESSYYLIKELQKSGVCNREINIDGLMNVFNEMVQYQLSCKEKRLELKQHYHLKK